MDTKVFYLRDERRFPVACVASRKNGSWIDYAVSVYNPRDDFNKHLGKGIALNRLRSAHSGIHGKGTVQMQPVGAPVEPAFIKKRIMQSILVDSHIPQRAKNAAARWLDLAEKQSTKKESDENQTESK